jgi:ATP:ADP antiporter, AAA family
MLFVIAIISFFLILIKFTDSKLAYMGIMVSKDLVWMFVGMEFGILTGMIFNIRQGKRLFGLLMSGEILAGIIGGLSINLILSYMSTINLLYISTITLVISFILLNYILNKYPNRFVEEFVEENTESNLSYKMMFKNRYYILFFAVSILSFFIFYFIDYLFYYNVEAKFTNEKELASFFGIFYAALNIINLFSSLFISGAMISRYGVIFGVMAIPILTLIGTSSLIFVSIFALTFGFVILIILKLLNEVFDISILNPTFKILYQSISPKQRMKILAFRETIIEPITMGLAGIFLIAISIFQSIEIIYYIILLMSLIWIILGKMLKDEYILSLKKLLHQREVFSDELSLKDIDINIFVLGIKSINDIEVLYCLDALIKIKYKDIDIVFKDLISHKSEKVRINILEYIDLLHRDNLINSLSLRIDMEKNPKVLNKVLKVYSKLGAVDAIEKLSPYLDDKDAIVQEGAIVALLQFTGIDGILIAGKVLNNLFDSSNKTDKIKALNILSFMSVPSFYKSLKESLNSDDSEIKSISIKVIGNLQIKKLVPNLLINLESNEYRKISINALIKFESKIFNDLVEYFEKTQTLSTKYALIKIISMIKSEKAYQFLLEHIKVPLLSDVIFEKLFDTNYISKKESFFKELILCEVNTILYYLNVSEILDRKSFFNTHIILQELISKKIENIFLILGFTYSKDMISQSMLNYKSNSKDTRAYTIEIIDNMVSQNIKKIVLPILEDISIEKKLSYYSNTLKKEIIKQDEFIQKILKDEDSPTILRLSIIYEIGKYKNKNYLNNIEKLINNKNLDIKQTAVWTLSQLKKDK